jgi:predicted SAM-dependent methyltransferase
MKCLNLGCGNRFIRSWTNVDFVSSSADVLAHDLTRGIPFADNTFDIVYHSHVLEHFTKQQASVFIGECYRTLVPGGHIRVAVPDLETLAILYLKSLEAVVKDENDLTVAEHQWSIIELLDQMVRTAPGGEMLVWWSGDKIINRDTVRGRMGYEFASFRTQLESTRAQRGKTLDKRPFKSRLKSRVKSAIQGIAGVGRNVDFRRSGEVHQWMYDRVSLRLLLSECGFENIAQVSAFDTTIEDWNEYKSLDQEDGEARKPDSLFLEARKPRGNA